MSHDDNVDALITRIAAIVAERGRVDERCMEELAREALIGQLGPPAKNEAGDATREALIVRVIAQAHVLIADHRLIDDIDEASIESFPASDPPAWIGQRPPPAR